jgi:NAD(P) transhydrogenase subunit alpha
VDAAGAAEADIICKVRKPSPEEVARLKEGAILVSLLRPMKPSSDETLQGFRARKITAFAMELVPRIARAQKMDALSSQANLAGYKAVLLAANAMGKVFPMMITAAGTVQPARVLVIGAGVAGLQAIATAKRLGALVEAFDTRSAAKEQVESVGGKFIALPVEEHAEDAQGYAKEVSQQTHEKELELIRQHARTADVVITTALIPGKKAPVLLTEDTVKIMKPGAVIVDLAAERGGNCPLTEADKEIVKHGVRILGYTNLPGMMAHEASQLYARNVTHVVLQFWKDGKMDLDPQDEVVKAALVTREGQVVNLQVQDAIKTGAEI